MLADFLIFFHCHVFEGIYNKVIIKYSTLPRTRCYITLWNIYVIKLACPSRCGNLAGWQPLPCNTESWVAPQLKLLSKSLWTLVQSFMLLSAGEQFWHYWAPSTYTKRLTLQNRGAWQALPCLSPFSCLRIGDHRHGHQRSPHASISCTLNTFCNGYSCSLFDIISPASPWSSLTSVSGNGTM